MAEVATVLDALASLPEATDDAERIDRIRALEQVRGAVAAAQAKETAAFAASRRADHSAHGTTARHVVRDIAGQVALARRISSHQARRYVGFAVVLTTELAATFDVLRAGETSEYRAWLIAQHTVWLSRQHRDEVDRVLAAELPSLGDKRVETRVREHAYRLDPRGYVERLRNAEKDRRVGLRPAPETMVRLSALLPLPDGVAAYTALSRDADTRRSAGDSRSRGQLMADTLVARVLGREAGEIPVEIELLMTDQTLLRPAADSDTRLGPGGAGSDEPAWLVGYGPLPAGYARSLVLDAADDTPRWIRRLYRAPERSELAAIDSRRRLFTAPQRRFVRLRDQFCRTSWCEAPIRQVDHVVPSAAGGQTHVANGQGLCVTCNQTKQAPGWGSRVDNNGDIETRTPTGHRYRSVQPRLPGISPGPPGIRPRSPDVVSFASPAEQRLAVIADLGRHAA